MSRRTRHHSSRTVVVNDELLRAAWDNTKTVKQNFQALGLAEEVNRDISSPAVRKKMMQWMEHKQATSQEVEQIRAEAKKRAEAENAIDMTPVDLGEEAIFGQLNAIFATDSNKASTKEDCDSEQAEVKLIDILQEAAASNSSSSEQNKQKKLRPLTEDEREVMSKLTKKHGNDCVAMAKDIKLNVMQYTPKQLESLLKRF